MISGVPLRTGWPLTLGYPARIEPLDRIFAHDWEYRDGRGEPSKSNSTDRINGEVETGKKLLDQCVPS